MKQNTKKISLLTLAAIGTMTLGLGVSALHAKADDALTTIAMAPGASVRLGATDGENTYNGIRFVAELGNYSEANDYSYGMIIIPFDYATTYASEIAAADGDYIAAAENAGVQIVNLKCLPVYGDGDMDGDEEWFIQGSLVELKPENLNRKFVGIGYFNDGSANHFATVTEEDNARTMSYVASKVIHGYTNDVASETDPYDVCLNYAYGGIGGSEFAITADASVELFVGASKKLTVAQAPAMDYFVAFESANNAVATVSADGTVTAVGAGETKILVKCVDKVVEVPVTVDLDWANIDYDFDDGATDIDLTTIIANYGSSSVDGIVDDNGVSAVKITRNGQGGVHIQFNNIDMTKYKEVNLVVRTDNTSAPMWVHVTGGTATDGTALPQTYVGALNSATYAKLNLNVANIKTLSEVRISRDNADGSHSFYIDKIEFVEKPDYSKYNYDFSSLTDNDVNAVAAGSGATLVGMVADATASDGYAVQVMASGSAGLIVNFGDIDISNYMSITLRLKSSNGYSLNINGTYVKYSGAANTWEEIELIAIMKAKSLGTTLSNLSFWRDNGGTHQCYVDSVTFVEKKVYDYTFSAADDSDMETCTAVSNESIVMVEDADAEDGWAVQCTIADGDGGLIINFDDIDISQYSQIIIRVKTGQNVNLNINGTYCQWPKYATYTEVDLIAIMQEKGMTTLSSVSFTRNVNQGIWVDWVQFIPAE